MPRGFGIVCVVATSLKKGFEAVQRRMAAAAELCGRDPSSVRLIAVTKTHPAALIRRAMKLGTNVFGENKVQEAEEKITEIGRENCEWHLIGHLQKNKARKAVQLFDCIHSVDSPELAHRLQRICEEEGRDRLAVLVQVDLAGEETKSGVPVRDLRLVAEALKRCSRLRFTGLMTIPPYSDDPEFARPYFKRLRELRDMLAAEGAFADGTGELSMGMSHDLEVAVEEGATMVRVGTAIFGERG